MCCTKFILFTTNAIIFVLGVIVVGISSAAINRGNEYGDLLMDGVVTLPVGILIVGLFVCIIGFLGCYGALRESKCMLYTYSAIILVLFIAELTIAILVIANPEAAKAALHSRLEDKFSNYGRDPALTKTIDELQVNLECCGVDNYKDWNNDTWTWDNEGFAPWSCCREEEGAPCKMKPAASAYPIHDIGCYEALLHEFQDIRIALAVSGLILAIFLFFSMATACGLAKKQP